MMPASRAIWLSHQADNLMRRVQQREKRWQGQIAGPHKNDAKTHDGRFLDVGRVFSTRRINWLRGGVSSLLMNLRVGGSPAHISSWRTRASRLCYGFSTGWYRHLARRFIGSVHPVHHSIPLLRRRAFLLAVEFFHDVAAENGTEPAGVARHPSDQFAVQREDDDLLIAAHATQHQFGGSLG